MNKNDDFDFGTDPRKLARREDPETSHAAAEALDSAAKEKLAFDAVAKFGTRGCIQDEVLALFPAHMYNTITPRFKALVEKGLIEATGERRKGRSGKMQMVRRVAAPKVDLLSKKREQQGLFE
jgi:hypothetical protein